ncbi:hypothetical protein K435DRAFT_595190, partial [Dendrothele bispora CBS 962.96]
IRKNIFLQSWKTYTSSSKQRIPELKLLTDVASKYNLRIEGVAFSREILRQMPIWYHNQANPRTRYLNSSDASECLRCQHNILTVGEAEDMALILNGRQSQHKPRIDCRCGDCTQIKNHTQCDNPHKCILRARQLLDTLPPKWDPRSELPEDYIRKPAPEDFNDQWIPFNNQVTTEGNLSDIFRIFTDKDTAPTNTLPDLKPGNQPQQLNNKITAATDGSCVNNGEDNARAGAGIYIEPNHSLNRAIKIPLYIAQSNQTGELVA